MRSKTRTLIFPVCAVVLISLSTAANASLYMFSQGGYSGGGAIIGNFYGIDIDGDGQISTVFGEVTSFSLSFSGDSLVGDFSHTLSDLDGLVYDVGSGFIGDGITGAIEGIASNWGGMDGFDYASGEGPLPGESGGRVIDIASGTISSTSQLVAVSAVPIPATIWLFCSALAGLGILGKSHSPRRSA